MRGWQAVLAWFEQHAVAVQALAAIVTLLVAIAALFGVKAQIDASARVQREQSARDIYREFLNLSIARPEFARPDYCAIVGSPREPAYEAYVDYLLYTAEQAIAADPAWQQGFARQLTEHRAYFCATEDWSDYDDNIVALVAAQQRHCAAVDPCDQ